MTGMGNAEISLLQKDAILQLEQKEKIGFEIGRDWAYYRQWIPENADDAIYAGYKSNTAHPSGMKETDRYTRKWLQVRYNAYLRNRPVADDVDATLIQMMDTDHCVITGKKLTHGTLTETDWFIERLCNAGGYTTDRS